MSQPGGRRRLADMNADLKWLRVQAVSGAATGTNNLGALMRSKLSNSDEK
jgi:hypothetical protein